MYLQAVPLLQQDLSVMRLVVPGHDSSTEVVLQPRARSKQKA